MSIKNNLNAISLIKEFRYIFGAYVNPKIWKIQTSGLRILKILFECSKLDGSGEIKIQENFDSKFFINIETDAQRTRLGKIDTFLRNGVSSSVLNEYLRIGIIFGAIEISEDFWKLDTWKSMFEKVIKNEPGTVRFSSSFMNSKSEKEYLSQNIHQIIEFQKKWMILNQGKSVFDMIDFQFNVYLYWKFKKHNITKSNIEKICSLLSQRAIKNNAKPIFESLSIQKDISFIFNLFVIDEKFTFDIHEGEELNQKRIYNNALIAKKNIR